MLEPGDRQLFTEALRPPEGYRFDCAVSTTFTLDLLTLLTVPVAFGLHQWASADRERRIDPLALLEAVRRHARRIHLFHDAGRIAVPARSQLLFSRLEESVIAVQAPNGGVFHPKVTVVRYVALAEPPSDNGDASAETPVCYRVLCASRNCTFDRSWDTMLVLEGDLSVTRSRAIARNRPLVDFFEALPGMATGKVPAQARQDVSLIADELKRVRFEPPEGFDDLAFWPIGLDAREVWPFQQDAKRMLVVSPFVNGTCLEWLGGQTRTLHLVSRVEAIDELSDEGVASCESLYVLNQAADGLEPQSEADDSSGAVETDEPDSIDEDRDAAQPDDDSVELSASGPPLRGLHAKLFVADTGRITRIWTGSANATTAAFERNVEFLVEMSGIARTHGVRKLLKQTSEDHENGDRSVHFRDLLVPYQRQERSTADQLEEKLERLIEDARKSLVAANLSARIDKQLDTNGNDPLYTTILEPGEGQALPGIPAGVEVNVRPITLRREAAASLRRTRHREVARFSSMSVEAITGFIAFDVEATHDKRTMSSGFVLNLPLVDPPPDREQRLLLAMLSNRERLLRYLLMLLDDPEFDPRCLFEGRGTARGDSTDGHEGDFGLPLLEPLMRALDGEPGRLEQIARLIDDLQATDGGSDLVPPSFLQIWKPIWAARKEDRHAEP